MGARVTFDCAVVNYRAYESLEGCLHSLVAQESENVGRIVVVDNSEVEPPGALARRFPSVRWVVNEKNVGFAKAVNQALVLGSAPFVCLINPDAVLSGPLWKPLEPFLARHPDCGIVGPKVVNQDGSLQGSARSFPTLATSFFGRTSLLSRIRPQNLITRRNILVREGQVDPVDVDWVSGACMFVRREAVEAVGPMDERFFLYWEDCDWCTRFRLSGWRVIYHPGAGPVVHQCGRASSHARRRSLYHFHRSAVLLYWKYDSSPGRIASVAALLGALVRFGLLNLRMGWR